MFVFMGSFQDVRNEKQKRSRTSAVGFGASFENSGSVTAADDKFHEELTMQDMIDYGMLEELAGRITLLINFHKLSRDDMKRLIDCKVKEISKECGFDIELTKQAEEKLVDVSYGSLGLRHPMNLIKNLSRNAVADVFFDNGFAYRRNKVVITSLETAEIQSKKIIREERENI
jgi:ATP-dependent protease Clp ATPase subunit